MIDIVTLDYKFTRENLSSIVNIEKEVFQHHSSTYDEYEWTEKEFLFPLPKKDLYSFGIRCNENLVGFSFGYEYKPCFFHISRVAILPEHSGKGLGKQLLTRQLQTMGGNSGARCSIDLTMRNSKAYNLYSGFGFKKLEGEILKGYVNLKNRKIEEYMGPERTHVALIIEF